MYVLSKEKVLTILSGLVEGHAIRALERMTGVNQNTIMSWLVRAGEAWTFVALDADTKLVISYLVGDRNIPTAYRLMQDIRRRTAGMFQLTTDGHVMYRDAAELAFGSDLNYGQLMKVYSGDDVVGARPVVVAGNPDVKKISTSYVERNNLTIRMSVRR